MKFETIPARKIAVVRDQNTPLAFSMPATREQVQKALRINRETRDDLMTFDRETVDSAGAFLIGELERLDSRLHMPLVNLTWSRDIDLRSDVTIADETSSFTVSSFGSPSGVPGSNKAWIGKNSTAIVNVSLDIGKTLQPLQLWAMQIDWTIPELRSAEKLGRPIDTQKFEALQLKHNMDTDEQVYIGDTALGMNGMLNHSAMTNVGNAVTGNWATATPAQILADINSLLNSVWQASGWAQMPTVLLLAPPEYTLLVSTLISSAGNQSIMDFVSKNNLATANGQSLSIRPLKWLLGTNNGGFGPTATDAMYAYSKDENRIRFPMVPLQRTPIEWRDIRQITTYFGRLGAVELVYPETTARRANLG